MTKPHPRQNTLYQTSAAVSDEWEQSVALAALRHVLGVSATFTTHEHASQLRRAVRLPSGGYAIEVVIGGRVVELSLPKITSRKHLQPVVAVLNELSRVAQTSSSFLKAVGKLQSFVPPPGYLGKHVARNGATVLLDIEQPCEASVIAGLQALAVHGVQRTLAIIGESDFEAQALDDLAREIPLRADVVLIVGEKQKKILPKLTQKVDTHYFERDTDAASWLTQRIKAHDTLLVAGSNLRSLVPALLR